MLVLVKNIHGVGRHWITPGLSGQRIRTHYRSADSIFLPTDGSRTFCKKAPSSGTSKSLGELRGYTTVEREQFEPKDLPRITELYGLLYLDKHSWLNPQYTEAFVSQACSASDGLIFRGLRHDSGRLDAVFGCFTSGTKATSTPLPWISILIYPPEIGFYRHLWYRCDLLRFGGR